MAKAKYTKAKIEKSLKNQLKAQGKNTPHLLSLAEDYASFWEFKELQKQSIEENGLVYEAVSSVGKIYEKDNPAVKMLPTYEGKMLDILKQLKLDQPPEEEDDIL